MKNKLINIIEWIAGHTGTKRSIKALAVLVVFVTTYILILPAFTLEKDEAIKQGGIDVPQIEQTSAEADDVDEVSAGDAAAEESGSADADSAAPADSSQPGTAEIIDEQAETPDIAAEKPDAADDANKEDKEAPAAESKADTDTSEKESKLIFEGDGYTVTVDDKASVLPENTEISVEEITADTDKKQYKQLCKDALAAVQDESGSKSSDKDKTELKFAKFYDIKLLVNGEEITPDDSVNISIAYDKALQKELKVEDKEGVRVIHFAEDKKTGETEAQILDSKKDNVGFEVKNNKLEEAAFDTSGFSVYAVVYTEDTIVAEYISANGETYTVTVKYDAEAGIPDGATLDVREIKEDSSEYNKYLKKSAKKLDVGTQDVTFARFFDITILDKGGNKIEPEKPVQVEIGYKDALELGSNKQLSVVHFASLLNTEVIDNIDISKDGTTLSYEQGSFSVTGTIITENPENGKNYVVVVKYNNKYYSVHNDGTLKPVDNAYDPATGKINLDLNYPLVWTYSDNNGYHNLSVPTVASGFFDNKLPSGYYYRFINPNADSGLAEENINNYTWVRDWSSLAYENNTIHGVNYGSSPGEDRTQHFIGISADGTKIVGNQPANKAAEVYLAEVNVPSPYSSDTHDDHMVDHIDISIAGGSKITVPLAYGTYYYIDDNGQRVEYTATHANHIVEMEQDIPIDEEDIKRASITATSDGKEVPDAFYISGYSQNAETGEGKLAQVRIEGSFKVADIEPAVNADWNPDVCTARKEHPIQYSIAVEKTIPVEVKINGHQLYKNDGTPLVFPSVPVSLSASFNYWDEGNKCPPVHEGLNEDADFVQGWKDGQIIGTGSTMSGMDFELGTAATGQQVRKLALEMTKVIQREDGSYLETNTPHSFDVDIYYKSKAEGEEEELIGVGVEDPVSDEELAELTENYTRLHSSTVDVETSGLGYTYDYDVNQDGGLFYIKEDKNSIDEYIIGADNKTYQYVGTSIETEYAWRTDGDENKVHTSDGLMSVPEVLGYYSHGDEQLDNTFLVFFVYNKYKEVETVDVPVDKTWYSAEDTSSPLDNTYSWSSTFVLEEQEVHVSGPVNPDANTTVWREVDGVGPLTITNTDNEAARTFENLPKYRYYPDGSVYRIMYSVDETAYELKHNGETISKWDKTNGLTVGEDVYSPHWPHDAGDADDEMHLTEDDPLFYHIIVENHKRDETIIDTLTDLNIEKQWEDGALEEAGVLEKDAFATFQLKRYVTTEHVSYDSSIYDGTDATVTLIGQDGNTDTLTVKKGARVNIVATFSGSGAVNYTIDGTGTNVEMSRYSGSETQTSQDILVASDMTIRANNQSWHGGHVSEDHLALAASGGSETSEDTEYTNEKHFYTLNRANGWTQKLDHLPLYSESAVINGEQNIYHYSYYFTEIDSNPSGYYSTYTDEEGNPIGDINHRVIDSDITIVAENKPIPPFAVEKEWYSIEDPDSYPEIRFTLYQGKIDGSGRLQRGSVFIDENGKSYEDIPLNSDNNWHWDCPIYLPETDNDGNRVGYYVMEKTSGNNSGHALVYQNSLLDEAGNVIQYGELITQNEGEKYDVKPLDYYNDKNGNHAKTQDQNFPEGWNGGIDGNTGTLTILNRTSKYMQMDIKKKILQVDPSDGHVDTIMDDPSKMRNIVLEIQLKRLVFDADTGTKISEDWEDYGKPFMIGFDDNNQPIMYNPNNFVLVKQGGFFWRVVLNTAEADSYGYAQNVGLPAYGYYTKEDGTIAAVRYRYIPFEIGVYSDLNKTPAKPEFEWTVGLQPEAWDGNGSQVHTFEPMLPNHDQDRIKNIQGSDLYVEKVWEELPTNIEEIYVKLYRSRGRTGEREDVTADIATRTETFSGYGFVEDPSLLTTKVQGGVLVIKPGTNSIHLHGLPLVYDTDNYISNPYYYWVEEVAYKDIKGNIYTDAEKFFPEYDRWDPETQTWSDWTTNGKEASTSLGQVSRNRIRANNAPTIEFKVQKEWYDENGNKLEAPWDESITSISFSVTRTAQKYVLAPETGEWVSDGDPIETELTFDNNGTTGRTITVTEPGTRAQVAVKANGGTEYSISYMNDSDDPEDIGQWAAIVDGLQKSHKVSDEELWRYSYKIGKEYSIAQCQTTISNTGAINDGETVTIANTKSNKGSVKVTKNFSGITSQQIPDDFKITASWGNQTRELTITGEQASDVTRTGSGLTYTWEISGLELDTEVTFVESGYDIAGYDVTINGEATASPIASIAKSSPDEKIFQNDYTLRPGDLELTKKVAGDGADSEKEFEFAIQLSAPEGGILAESYKYTKTGTTGEQTVTLDRTDENTKATITGVKLKANEVYTIIGLPVGTVYTITEADYSADGYSAQTTSEDNLTGTITGGTKSKESIEVTNTYSAGGLTVEKTTTGSGANPNDSFNFRVTIVRRNHASGNHGKYKIGTDEHDVTFTNGTAVVEFALKDGEKAEFSGIQAGASFTVEELSADQNGYETTVTSTGGTVTADKKVTGTIDRTAAITASYINSKETVSLDILKVNDEDDTIKLEGAVFEINRIEENNSTITVVSGTKQEVTTDENGAATFGDLTKGYYQIKETSAPDGYVISTDPTFYVMVGDDGVQLVSPVNGAPPVEWAVTTSVYGKVKTFTAASGTANAEATIGNESGAELPHTGGIGTTIFYILGSILVIGCGVVLASRRRINKNTGETN